MSKKRKAPSRRARTAAALQSFNNMPLDLTKDEKMRCAALTMAINYYIETICKDAALYTAMTMKGDTLKPATYDGVVAVALRFEAYLAGKIKEPALSLPEEKTS